ncbi:hypothetical protein FRC17_011194 [Serendipita sp. 399]|nr:hypothetical protein FRC17_011194 [Serendipita sp. 399]
MDTSTQESTTAVEWRRALPQVVYSDRVPSESERGQIIDHIRIMKATQQELEKEVEAARRGAGSTGDPNFELRIAKAREGRELIERLEGSLSAIRLFPDELVGEVFGYCLWSAITIPLQVRMKIGSVYRFHKSRHYCSNAITLQNILSLSGKAPLNIIIENVTPEITTALVQERERWETVEFYDIYESSALFEPTAPCTVRKIVFASSAFVPFHWLERVQPVTLCVRSTKMAPGQWWERLQEFSFSRQRSWNQEKADNLLSALQGTCKQLIRLELVKVPFPSQIPLQFPRLRELSVCYVDGWQLIECDSLTKLKFCSSRSVDGHQTTYQLVQELDISDLHYEGILAQLHLPILNTLIVGNRTCKDILQCPRDICEKVTKVRLCLQTLNSPQLCVDLDNFSCLGSLEIYNTSPFHQFFKRFEAGHERPPLCPTLKRLSVDFFDISHAIRKDELVVTFQKIVESRRLSHPLLSLRVQWPVRHAYQLTEFV